MQSIDIRSKRIITTIKNTLKKINIRRDIINNPATTHTIRQTMIQTNKTPELHVRRLVNSLLLSGIKVTINDNPNKCQITSITFTTTIIPVKNKTKKKKKTPLNYDAQRRIIFSLLGKKCCRCGVTENGSNNITLDHIRPKSKNPTLVKDIANMAPLCVKCNSHKSDRHEADYRTYEQRSTIASYLMGFKVPEELSERDKTVFIYSRMLYSVADISKLIGYSTSTVYRSLRTIKIALPKSHFDVMNMLIQGDNFSKIATTTDTDIQTIKLINKKMNNVIKGKVTINACNADLFYA